MAGSARPRSSSGRTSAGPRSSLRSTDSSWGYSPIGCFTGTATPSGRNEASPYPSPEQERNARSRIRCGRPMSSASSCLDEPNDFSDHGTFIRVVGDPQESITAPALLPPADQPCQEIGASPQLDVQLGPPQLLRSAVAGMPRLQTPPDGFGRGIDDHDQIRSGPRDCAILQQAKKLPHLPTQTYRPQSLQDPFLEQVDPGCVARGIEQTLRDEPLHRPGYRARPVPLSGADACENTHGRDGSGDFLLQDPPKLPRDPAGSCHIRTDAIIAESSRDPVIRKCAEHSAGDVRLPRPGEAAELHDGRRRPSARNPPRCRSAHGSAAVRAAARSTCHATCRASPSRRGTIGCHPNSSWARSMEPAVRSTSPGCDDRTSNDVG